MAHSPSRAGDLVPVATAAPASEAERLYPTSLREEEHQLLVKRVAWWKLRLTEITTALEDLRSGNQSDDVRKAEDARLVEERDSIQAMQDRHRRPRKRLVGLALSGGGLRSATFSLGFLQVLAREKLLRQVDYLSTVSGGSYIGAFLGALYHRRAVNTPDTRDAEVELADRRSKVIDWLRENGRYLAPGGAADGWVALAVIFRNLATVNGVIWIGVLTAFLGLNILRGLVTGLLGWWGHALPLGGGTIWWSVSLLLPAATVPLCLVPLALAYWLVPDDPVNGTTDSGILRSVWGWVQRHVALVATTIFMTSTIVTLRLLAPPLNGRLRCWGPGVIVLGTIVAVVVLAAAWLLVSSVARGDQTTGTPPSLIARQRLTRWMRAWLIAAVMLFLAGLVDSLGQTLYRALIDQAFRDIIVPALAAGASSLMGVTVGAQKMLGVVGVKSAKFSVPLRILALGGALVLILPIVVALSAVSHGLAWDWAHPIGVAATTAPPTCPGEASSASEASLALTLEEPAVPVIGWPLAELALGLVLCAAFGRIHALLNGSSIATLYAARLNRAYVGASNPTRLDNAQIASTELLADDSIRMADYAPYEAGGPLHIINTTLNETIGGRSQVQERDRKGMNLAFGPAGISVAARHHALWKMVVKAGRNRRSHLVSADRPEDAAPGEFRVFPVANTEGTAEAPALEFHPEILDLGRWTAISGAAASTALGSMTSLGLSLLCGVLNVRLGHWWWSGVDPRLRGSRSRPGWLRRLALLFSRALPVQGHLLDELIARFPGTGTRNWYLTDGGHFENTGVYELIRRRLPVIIALDNGADPRSTLADVANLVRKARMDFDAEIQFLDRAALDDKKLFVDKPAPSYVGTVEDVGRKASAALARISYAKGGDETGWLLLVKPAVIGKESVDVREYRAAHPDFPQQTTIDQFFDEAQWESYRKLGELIGTQLFADGALSDALEILKSGPRRSG